MVVIHTGRSDGREVRRTGNIDGLEVRRTGMPTDLSSVGHSFFDATER